jgi:hypothetical protein
MAALRSFVPELKTRYLAWLDNDTFVTPGWRGALLDRAAVGAQVILPVTLEREGLDADPRRLPLRNHISHLELREVTAGGRKYVFDHKPFRRAAPEELPKEAHTVDFFELTHSSSRSASSPASTFPTWSSASTSIWASSFIGWESRSGASPSPG